MFDCRVTIELLAAYRGGALAESRTLVGPRPYQRCFLKSCFAFALPDEQGRRICVY